GASGPCGGDHGPGRGGPEGSGVKRGAVAAGRRGAFPAAAAFNRAATACASPAHCMESLPWISGSLERSGLPTISGTTFFWPFTSSASAVFTSTIGHSLLTALLE